MTPILYEKNCTDKIEFLSDAVSCTVTEERNGEFTLEMQYPTSGKAFFELAESRIIKAKPNQTDENQFFIITSISKPHNGNITISANHISYLLSGYPVKSFTQSGVAASAVISSLLGIANTYDAPHSFTLGTCDLTSTSSVDFKALSVRAALGGTEGSVLDKFGGEFHFNNFAVSLLQHRGADNGVRIAYGKNLTAMKLDINTDSAYTGIFPYCYNDEEYVTLNETVIYVDNDSGIEDKILVLDCSSLFAEGVAKTEANLRAVANEYLNTHDINAVSGSLTVEFVDLSKVKAFDLINALEAVNLCDTVKVIHPKLNVSVSMKVIKTVYDVVAEKYIKLELGTPRSSFADTISQATKTAETAYKKATDGQSQLAIQFNEALDDATAAITGASGGHVVLYPSENPQEIRILVDTNDIETSQKYWRWNSAGLGFTTNDGQSFIFSLLGADGKLIINDVTARQISASLIVGDILKSVNNESSFNLNTGHIIANWAEIKGGTISIGDTSSGYRTVIRNGAITQLYENVSVSAIAALADSNDDKWLYFLANLEYEENVKGFKFGIYNTDTTSATIAELTGAEVDFYKPVKFNNGITGNTTFFNRIICDANIDIEESGFYLRTKLGGDYRNVIGYSSGLAPNLHVGAYGNTPGYNDIYYNSQNIHKFYIKNVCVGYVDADGFHNGEP